jgi:hypothetical protein
MLQKEYVINRSRVYICICSVSPPQLSTFCHNTLEMGACTQTDMVSQGFHDLTPISVDSEGVSNESGSEQALTPETEISSEGPEISPCELVVRK